MPEDLRVFASRNNQGTAYDWANFFQLDTQLPFGMNHPPFHFQQDVTEDSVDQLHQRLAQFAREKLNAFHREQVDAQDFLAISERLRQTKRCLQRRYRSPV